MLDLEHYLSKKSGFDLGKVLVKPSQTVSLARDFDPDYTGEFKDKSEAEEMLRSNIELLAEQQDILYANASQSLLLILQAMDAAGKDSTIKHVMSGVNPQGCQVYSFKAPSGEELRHDYLWRTVKCLPELGRIGIFNRSYYEEVLVVRVHPELLVSEHLSPKDGGPHLWKRRFEEINNFEHHLTNNQTTVLKFFLNVSRREQKKRFLKRIEQKDKNWKFSASDIRERQFWDKYMISYEEAFSHTSTPWAPWFVVPADHKWFTRLCVSQITVATLKALALKYPKPTKEQLDELEKAKQELLKEED
jgi:PPK2 family polyphosphate:nucleotide phosphotransferase